jgi:hypothetical protein
MEPHGQDAEISPNSADRKPAITSAIPSEHSGTEDSGVGKKGDTIMQAVRDVAGRQKQAGADVIDATSQAIRSAANDLEGQSPTVADVIRDGAERMSSTASALRERNVDELFDAAGRFARERPAAVFGMALIAGLALSRFLKSSTNPQPRGEAS